MNPHKYVDLSHVEKLIRNGNIAEVERKLHNIDLTQRSKEEVTKIKLLRIEVGIEIGEVLESERELGDIINDVKVDFPLLAVDALILKIMVYRLTGNQDGLLSSLTIAEEILSELASFSSEENWFQRILKKGFLKIRSHYNPDTKNQSISKDDFAERDAKIKYQKAFYYFNTNRYEEAKEVISQSLEICNDLGYEEGISDCYYLQGLIERNTGQISNTVDLLDKSLEIREKLGIEKKIAFCLYQLAIIQRVQGDYQTAIELFSQSLEIREKLGNPIDIGATLYNLSWIYKELGDYERSYHYAMKSYELRKSLGNEFEISRSLVSLASIKYLMGNDNEAIDFVKQTERYLGSGNFSTTVISIISPCIEIATNLGYQDLAKSFFEFYTKNSNESESNFMNKVISLYLQSLIFKSSDRTIEIAKAQEGFQQVIDDSNAPIELTFRSAMELIQLLLAEMKSTNNFDILGQINQISSKLYESANGKNLYRYMIELNILRSKTQVAAGNLSDGMKLLSEALALSENGALSHYQPLISNEYDDLLEQQSNIENMIESETEANELLTEIGLDSLIERLIRNQVKQITSTEEDPILLMIMTDGGTSIYSKEFSDTGGLDDQLVSGFLSAVNAFSRETFASQGSLDRIKHQEYTILMKPLDDFTFCYVYKGPSFSANKKLKSFLAEIKEIDDWNKFIEVQDGKALSSNLIDNLVNSTFSRDQ